MSARPADHPVSAIDVGDPIFTSLSCAQGIDGLGRALKPIGYARYSCVRAEEQPGSSSFLQISEICA